MSMEAVGLQTHELPVTEGTHRKGRKQLLLDIGERRLTSSSLKGRDHNYQPLLNCFWGRCECHGSTRSG